MSLKAALLSAFVFPGLGHFYLKQRIKGALLAGAALAALVLVISNVMETAMQLSDAILRGELQPDAAAITEALARQPPDADALLVNGAYVVLVVVWLIGIVGAYRAGRTSAGTHNGGQGK
jgi:hypothetical protein